MISPQEKLSLLKRAIRQHQVLQLTYVKAGGSYSERTIEPQALYLTSNTDWRLVAWCRLRQAYREFNLDRIQELTPTGEQAPPRFFQLSTFFAS